MKPSMIALAFVGLSVLPIRAQLTPVPKLDEATEKMLIANERALYGAVAKADTRAFQSLVSPDGFWATPTGFVPMGPLGNDLSVFELPTWDLVNAHVVWHDGESALVLYSRTGGGAFAHQRFAPMTLASTLWTKRDGKWRASYHQESDLKQ